MTPAQRRKFHKSIVLGSTSDIDLASYFQGRKHKNGISFGGVFSNDELRKPEPNKVYILNLENSNEGGSHWTLLFNGWYFDSYACPPTKRISQFVHSYNQLNFQGLNRTSCGYYTLYVADHIMNGENPIGELQPDRQTHNENILEEYFCGR
jgi:hypothetical protein